MRMFFSLAIRSMKPKSGSNSSFGIDLKDTVEPSRLLSDRSNVRPASWPSVARANSGEKQHLKIKKWTKDDDDNNDV
jgi:hypothetical protein